jgi:hypothetical protein
VTVDTAIYNIVMVMTQFVVFVEDIFLHLCNSELFTISYVRHNT